MYGVRGMLFKISRMRSKAYILKAATLTLATLVFLSTALFLASRIESIHAYLRPNDFYLEVYRPDPAVQSYVSVLTCDGARIGNTLFRYASTLAIAMQTQKTLLLEYCKVTVDFSELFHVNRGPLIAKKNIKMTIVDETEHVSDLIRQFSQKQHSSWYIDGYLQSWKNFHPIRETIQRHFKIRKKFREKAQIFLRDISQDLESKTKKDKDKEIGSHTTTNSSDGRPTTFVSIHNRRGDLDRVPTWYVLPSATFFQRAINYFVERKSQFPNLVFIVATDDLIWTKSVMSSARVNQGVPVVYSEGRSAEEDFSILASCNHSIISIGTFGWWGAWLAGGTTVYHKEWAGPDLPEVAAVSGNYWPPHWIGI